MEPAPDFGLESYKGSGRLKGKSAIITGGDSGIGRAVALAFAREGADVLISYLNEHEDAQKIASIIEKEGRRCVLVPGDLCREQHCKKVVDTAVQEFGKVDILVNNAAFQMAHDSILEISSEELEYTFRTNIFSMFYLCQACLSGGHIPKGGSIINVTSIQAYQPSAELIAYSSTKGAILTFTKALAKEALEKYGVRVNGVAPGPIWTPLIPMSFGDEKVQHFGEETPMKRPGQPVELAPVFVFLACSEQSSYINGEVIGATGGRPIS